MNFDPLSLATQWKQLYPFPGGDVGVVTNETIGFQVLYPSRYYSAAYERMVNAESFFTPPRIMAPIPRRVTNPPPTPINAQLLLNQGLPVGYMPRAPNVVYPATIM